VSRVRENRMPGSTGGGWKRNATASPRQSPTQPSSRRDTATVVTAHAIAHDAEHRLIHAVGRLSAAVVHAEPHSAARDAHHEPAAAHR